MALSTPTSTTTGGLMTETYLNKSFVMRGVEDAVFEERAIPDIDNDEVLVQVKKTGICGSDVHFLVDGRIGHLVVSTRFEPIALRINAMLMGSNINHLKPGMQVALEPGKVCRTCEVCKSGRYELCPKIEFAATPPKDGTLGKYYRIPADLAYPLPDNLTLEDGAMIEPLSVAVHALYNIGQLRVNENVAIFGAGPIGLVSMAVAKACGAKRIIAIDINNERLLFAKAYAATDIFLPPAQNEGESNMDYSDRAMKNLMKALSVDERGAGGVDIVLDASGAEVSIQMAIFLAKPGGTLVQVGLGNPNVQIPITLLLTKELQLKGSFRYGPGDYPLAIALVAQGKVDLKPLITHRFAFEDSLTAFEATKNRRSSDGRGVIKAIISGPE